LEVARQIQSSLIPLHAPEIPGFDIRGCWRSAREVAGDFYDFILRPNGELAVVIGDVTDKGIPAAFFMALARTTIRASLMTDAPAETCITNANQLICADSSSGMFVTLYYLELKPGEQTITTLSAGHNPPIRVNAVKRV
jgi:sigma-B regulation protein RsbU (phosphoserine phosphatase)